MEHEIIEYPNGTKLKKIKNNPMTLAPPESQPSIEEQILFETKYQTMLLEMNTLL